MRTGMQIWPTYCLTNNVPGQTNRQDRECGAKFNRSRSRRHTWVRASSNTIFHRVGSCAMGDPAAGAVTDARLRVHGLAGLRVADASIMPAIVGGNTSAPAMMIAERRRRCC